jgi:hypothetical protein
MGRAAHPTVLVTAFVLALNDHVLKHADVLPGWLTGKLSDFAGLFVFPIVVSVLAERLVGPRRYLRAGIAAGTAAGFAALNCVPWVSAVVQPILPNTMDPTDLVALPAVGLALLWLARRRARPVQAHRVVRLAAVTAVALACVATSPPYFSRVYPLWTADADNLVVRDLPGGAQAQVWVARSSKTGFGLLVQIDKPQKDAVEIVLTGADARLHDGTRVLGSAAEPNVVNDHRQQVYVAFPFDNDSAWRNGEPQSAHVTLFLTVGDEPATVHLDLQQVSDGHHRVLR